MEYTCNFRVRSTLRESKPLRGGLQLQDSSPGLHRGLGTYGSNYPCILDERLLLHDCLNSAALMSLGTTIIPSNRVPQRGNYNFLFTSENCVLPQSIHTSSSQEFRRAVWKSKPSPKRRLGLSGFQRMSAAPSFADFMGQQDKSLSSVLLAFEVRRLLFSVSL